MHSAGQLASKSLTGTGPQATPGDVIQAVRDVVPVAGRGLVDTDLQVRRSSADALLQAAAALNNQVPQPREGEAPLDTKDDRDLKLFEDRPRPRAANAGCNPGIPG